MNRRIKRPESYPELAERLRQHVHEATAGDRFTSRMQFLAIAGIWREFGGSLTLVAPEPGPTLHRSITARWWCFGVDSLSCPETELLRPLRGPTNTRRISTTGGGLIRVSACKPSTALSKALCRGLKSVANLRHRP